MDPITHTLAGATLARAGLDRRTPLAAATLMLGANAPDIDIVMMLVGEYAAIAFRRGWTHGPLAWPLLVVALTGMMLAWDRWVRRRRSPGAVPADPAVLLLLATIGVLSHPALDWLNTYGIRLLMPLSPEWFYGDAVFIIDPYVWLVLGGALTLPRRTVRRVQLAGMAVVAYVIALIGASLHGERLAQRVAEARGLGVREVMYQPRPADPFSGDLVVVTDDAYHRGRLRWLAAERVRLDDDAIPRGDWRAPAVLAALDDPAVRDYLAWSRYPYVRVEATAEGTAVFFGDARFAEGISAGGLQGVRVPRE
jgi:inner membrane protein